MSARKIHSLHNFIIKEIVPELCNLTLVADKNKLLSDEWLVLELHKRGFELIEYTDPIEFRYVYEVNGRISRDRVINIDQVVVLLQDIEFDYLPYDLLQAGRRLSFSLADIFPNLSYPVIGKLDRKLLDDLFIAQNNHPPDQLGANATKDYILRHVFHIDIGLITNEVQLLRVLLHMHYSTVRFPDILANRLVKKLKDQSEFKAWPLSEIVPDSNSFFAFLQERWPIFISSLGDINYAREEQPEYNLIFDGPSHLPFDHQDIKVYIDNLFLEGRLKPIEAEGIDDSIESWIRSGLAKSEADDELRITRLFEKIDEDIPTIEVRHSAWIAFATKWAELSSLVHCSNDSGTQYRLREVGESLNTVFADWLSVHYSSLINLPPTNPPMLHHVPRHLARAMNETNVNRVALIVVDGLALDQWVTARQLLHQQDASLIMRESATFAWIPTMTSVSRQSIFSGKSPFYFPAYINSTNYEEKLWKQFWESHGLPSQDVAYRRGLGDGNATDVLEAIIHPSKTRVVGLVVDKVDKIMHGMQLGSAGMHNQIIQWCQAGFLTELIDQLLNLGYSIWLTSDHGNIQCEGKGRPSEGVIAETRGERVRVYPTSELRAQVAKSFPFSRVWEPVGLPEGYYPLVTNGHDAFVKQGETIVGHGGISIEEVIVPLIKFERRSK